MTTDLDEWELTVAMWEDLIYLSAFQVIHGPVAGYRRYRYLRFGVPESEPLPEGIDWSRPMPLPIWRREP